jgi:TonB family protein
MNTSERGGIPLGALVVGGVCILVLCGFFYKYRQDLQRYMRGPQAVVKARAPEGRKLFGRGRTSVPMPAATPRLPSYTIIGELNNRRVIHHELPEYPLWAEEEGISGRVKLAFRVNSQGEVYPNVWLKETVGNPEIDQAAITALKHWKFAPLKDPGSVPPPSDMVSEATPGQAGVINFNFMLSSKPMRL